jgi:hypothetical protein
VGSGRSGTNWLLDILDTSPFTHCRSEPDGIPGSPFRKLQEQSAAFFQPSPELFETWEQTLQWSKVRMGTRDHHVPIQKHHMYRASHRLGLSAWPVRPKVRKSLAILWPPFRQNEWLMPWWIGDLDRLKQACGVFKVSLHAWIVTWILYHCPHIPILHIVRYPGGVMNSALTRFWSQCSPSQAQQELVNIHSELQKVVHCDPSWASVFGPIEAMDWIEAVMWFWRYNNEKIFEAGQGHSQYKKVLYEDLAHNPLVQAQAIYQFCHLPWGDRELRLITQGNQRSVWGKLPGTPTTVAAAWKTKLDPKHLDLINRVLDNSLMQFWWNQSGSL